MKVELTKFDESFLDQSWIWLNDPEIKDLISASTVTKEEQLKWFEKIKTLDDYLIWGLIVDKYPVGVCGLKKITNRDCEYWGYIGEKEYWGKGLGTQIMLLMENEARKMQLESIWLQVNDNNIRAIKLYEKMKFETEDTYNKKLIMRKMV